MSKQHRPFHGGGFGLLGAQALGVVSVAGWVAVTMTIVFMAIKKTIGLRVSRTEEVRGLDITEHGLSSSYADFMVSPTGTDFMPQALNIQDQHVSSLT